MPVTPSANSCRLVRPTMPAPAARAPRQDAASRAAGSYPLGDRPAAGGRGLARHVDQVLDGEPHPRPRGVVPGDECGHPTLLSSSSGHGRARATRRGARGSAVTISSEPPAPPCRGGRGAFVQPRCAAVVDAPLVSPGTARAETRRREGHDPAHHEEHDLGGVREVERHVSGESTPPSRGPGTRQVVGGARRVGAPAPGATSSGASGN